MCQCILTYDQLIDGNTHNCWVFSFTIILEVISRVGAQLNKNQKRVVWPAEWLFMLVGLYNLHARDV